MEHTFEQEEMTVFGIDVIASGTVEFGVEDTAVGSLPYGDTYVWHPGNGHQAVDVKLTDLSELNVSGKYKDGKCLLDACEVNIFTLLKEGKDKVMESIAMQVELEDAIESAMESAKEEAELARYGL